jgi:antitoxin CptB
MNPNRLTWLCRRGMRELDVILTGYLAKGYPAAPAAERERFHRLLEASDDTLWRYFYQDLIPEDHALAALVDTIRRAPAPHP